MTYKNNLERLNLSRNGLGFKTGAYAMGLLVQTNVKSSTKLKKLDLSYNTISQLV